MKHDRLTPQLHALLDTLSSGARAWLEREEPELLLANSRTRLHIAKSGVPNPLRWLHARGEGLSLVDEEARLADLPEPDKVQVRGLGFRPVGRVKHRLVEFEIWTGPEGFVQLECVEERRFMMVLFEDNQKIVVTRRDEVSESLARTQSEAIYLWASEDFSSDYGRLLEAAAMYAAGSDSQPLYHYEDRDLSLEVSRYYDRHAVSLRWVGNTQLHHAAGWIFDKLGGLGLEEKFKDSIRESGRATVEGMEWPARLKADGLRVACPKCGGANRIPPDRLGSIARCGKCAASVPTTDYPIMVESFDAFFELITDAPIPVVVDFWAAWCGPCVASLPEVRKAAKESDGKYALLWVDSESQELLGARYLIRSLPTMVRLVDGLETHRLVGAHQADAIARFAAKGEGTDSV